MHVNEEMKAGAGKGDKGSYISPISVEGTLYQRKKKLHDLLNVISGR